MKKETLNFKNLLDDHHEWPSEYLFKFIVKSPDLSKLMDILDDHDQISKRPSKKGNYISVTSLKIVESSNHVMQIYQKTSVISSIVNL
jgi:putative lipoic acid-binding regulatory protein